jgi:hypothetical protein
MQYSEIIAVCSEIHTKHINILCGHSVQPFNVKPGGIYNYHWAQRVTEANQKYFHSLALIWFLVRTTTHTQTVYPDTVRFEMRSFDNKGLPISFANNTGRTAPVFFFFMKFSATELNLNLLKTIQLWINSAKK